MVDVARSFGQVLGPRGKMPNPKIGCVVPPKTNLQLLYDKLQKSVMLSTKKGGTSVKTIIGNEEMKDEEIDTVGGPVFCLAGKVPKKEEVFQYKNFLKLKILSATDRRINTLEIDKI